EPERVRRGDAVEVFMPIDGTVWEVILTVTHGRIECQHGRRHRRVNLIEQIDATILISLAECRPDDAPLRVDESGELIRRIDRTVEEKRQIQRFGARFGQCGFATSGRSGEPYLPASDQCLQYLIELPMLDAEIGRFAL